MVFKYKEKQRIMSAICLLSMTLYFSLVVAREISRYNSYMDRRNTCVNTPINAEKAQDLHKHEYSRYACDQKELSKFAENLCLRGNRSFCGASEDNNIGGARATINISINKNGKYDIWGVFSAHSGTLADVTVIGKRRF